MEKEQKESPMKQETRVPVEQEIATDDLTLAHWYGWNVHFLKEGEKILFEKGKWGKPTILNGCFAYKSIDDIAGVRILTEEGKTKVGTAYKKDTVVYILRNVIHLP